MAACTSSLTPSIAVGMPAKLAPEFLPPVRFLQNDPRKCENAYQLW